MRLGGELTGLADLLVEDRRGHVAAQLADTASEGSRRVSQPRTCVGGRGDDDLADDRGVVAGPHRGGGQHVESFAASRVQRKRLIDRDGVRVECSVGVAGLHQQHSDPCSRTSWSSDSEYPSTACLVAAYKAMNGAGTRPRTELTLMVRPPPCSRICGSTARVIRIEPKTLVSNSARACSIELSSAAPAMPTPALLTSTSIRPDRSSTSRTTPATDRSSVTSSGRNTTPSRFSPAAALRLVPYTVNPAPTSACAAASPMPADAPVTSATGCVSTAMMSPSFDCLRS